ncbi:MAG: RNA-binding transcriptional accessory protein [Campylobacterales bacterium]|nr:RNA-binding transcriptional accessory protein [Campylobacterales bacterium]
MQDLITLLSQKTNLKKNYISNILKLLDDGCTIPFIARYRKEMSGGADDETLREFESIYISAKKLIERKGEIIRLISERATLTKEIEASIEAASTMVALEDIYQPYKDKKNSRASVAISYGLEGLADILQSAKLTINEFKSESKKFLNDNVKSVDEAIKGAQDILAQRYADDAKERQVIRDVMMRYGILEIKRTKMFDEGGVFKNFGDKDSKSEKISYIPSHRYLAIMRGVKEKQLSVKIKTDIDRIEENIKRYKIPKNGSSSKEFLFEAYLDGLKRLLIPSIERDIHNELKERADIAAINTFGKNLNQLLITPPLSSMVILGVDPGFVSGCKLAVIDENGKYLDSGVIYPTKPKEDYENSKKLVLSFAKKYGVNAVAIGNGTASRETQEFFARLNTDIDKKLNYTIVSEAGASVYSASKIAKEEYPDLDVTIRGAISIAQRLRDPMAALVKIDPKSLGIGQYQHDVDQKLLAKRLDDITGDLVNRVGVDVNSASFSLLSYVAGIGKSIAKNIIIYREQNGVFKTKDELLKVKGLGKKGYEQAVGFLRIKNGKSEFDDTGIHPESYHIAKKLKMVELKNIDVSEKAKELQIGSETLKDIIDELLKPGFDPRSELPSIPFKDSITDVSMLKEGSVVSGVVRNVTDFGAFVDIGLKNDGLIHISKISDKRISHPLEILSLNQYLPIIKVLGIDVKNNKVSLGLVD